MRSRTIRFAIAGLGLACGAPLWAVSLSTVIPAQPIPQAATPVDAEPADATELAGIGIDAAGSTTLVPLVATDMQAQPAAARAVDTAENGSGPVGKPLDDLQFVRQAAENGRNEVHAARLALPQIEDPELRRLAEMLVDDHGGANERLAQLAQAKGWPVPGPAGNAAAPPAGSAGSDFDARFTAQMIARHERSVALYRAQAVGGEDQDLRRYAKDTLPTIEKHLAEFRRLQK